MLGSISSPHKNKVDDADGDAADNIYLGERYGYRLHAKDGFNYITGGGGIIFSLSVVKLILKHCTCPSPTSPDDMILGSCLHSLQVKAQHSARFHQVSANESSSRDSKIFAYLILFKILIRKITFARNEMLESNENS